MLRSASQQSFVVQEASKAGHDIRAVGSDIKQGQAVLQAGDMLDAPEIGILATVGSVNVKVTLSTLSASCKEFASMPTMLAAAHRE